MHPRSGPWYTPDWQPLYQGRQEGGCRVSGKHVPPVGMGVGAGPNLGRIAGSTRQILTTRHVGRSSSLDLPRCPHVRSYEDVSVGGGWRARHVGTREQSPRGEPSILPRFRVGKAWSNVPFPLISSARPGSGFRDTYPPSPPSWFLPPTWSETVAGTRPRNPRGETKAVAHVIDAPPLTLVVVETNPGVSPPATGQDQANEG